MEKEELKRLVNKLVEQKDKDEIVKQLQKINECFLTKYKINFKYKGKTINIIPIETEIYYYNENIDKNIFEDKMIHKNDLQKNNFGKLYFHRIQSKEYENMKWGAKKTNPIDLKRCGVDVCISNSEEYYLSILIRSALINGIEKANMFSGINKICKKIINIFNPKDCLQCFLYELECIPDVIQIREENKEHINIEKIFYQQRIAGENYSSNNIGELNCLNLGEYLSEEKQKENKYKYLKWIKQNFYTTTKKQEIIEKYH